MLSFLLSFSLSEQKVLSVNWDSASSRFVTTEDYDETALARAIYSNDQNETGWYNLQVEGPRKSDNQLEAKAAGYLEAKLTGDLFLNHRTNVYAHICAKYVKCDNGEIPDKLKQFFSQNLDWVEQHIAVKNNESTFYFAAKMIMAQIDGLVEGLNEDHPNEQITKADLWMYMSHAMIYDLARTKGMNLAQDDAPVIQRRGTAIVGRSSKPDNIFIGQTAWRHYGESIRIAKRYRIRFSSSLQIADRRSLSSYPFMIHSDDEFTISDQGLVVISSSIAMTKENAAAVHYSVQGMPYWFRSVAATLSAHSAGEWYEQYKDLMSTGTGIEYLIVDVDKFKYKEGFADEFVFVIDELPNNISGVDATPYFREKRFIGSYDVPYIEGIYKAAGYDTLAAQDPDWYSYTDSVRAKILQTKAQTIYQDSDLQKLIRLNDPSSVKQQNGSAVNAIAGRYDLNKDTSLQECYGAYDAKITTLNRILHVQWAGQVGATRDSSSVPALNLDTNAICKDESRVGVDPKQYNDWYDQYFDIEID